MTFLSRINATLFVLAAFLFAPAGTVSAEMSEVPMLRASVVVDGDLVRLGDIFANAGRASEVAVFQAPAPGSSGMVSAGRLIRVAHQHGLDWDNPENLHKVSIVRTGIEISLDDVAALIEETIASELNLTDAHTQFSVEFANSSDTIYVPIDENPVFDVARLRFNRRSGQFSALVTAPAGSPSARQYSFSGRAEEVRAMAVLVRPVERGQVIGANDVEERLMPVRNAAGDTVYAASDIVGKAARRSLRAERPLRTRDLEEPRIVRRNNVVTVTYQIPGLTVTVRARALDDGSMGETVRILNLQSNRVIEGTVVGTDAVAATVTNAHVVASTD